MHFSGTGGKTMSILTKEDFLAGKKFKINNSKLFAKTYVVFEGSIHTWLKQNSTMFKCNYECKYDDGFYIETTYKKMPLSTKIQFKDCELVT